jgi:hypothetical protein
LRFAFALGAPLLIGAVWCALMRPQASSLLAPVLGPWAGTLFGHAECTLASVAPAWSWISVAGGLLTLAAALWSRGRFHPLTLSMGALWSLSWSATAVLSVANTCA